MGTGPLRSWTLPAQAAAPGKPPVALTNLWLRQAAGLVQEG